jgi:FAD/FMN-containing dehydrogenase
MATAPTTPGFDELQGFSGELLRDADAGYEVARRVHNGMIDRRPALIARCLGTADIVDAVNYAVANSLDIAVRGGGHNVAGNAVCDGGLVVDLSLMQGVDVDPANRIARAQPGATWARFNRETQLHGLATTGGVISTTGVAGLTLGGGLGWLMGKYGMAVDNMIAAEVVTADGRVVRASSSENPDLFWAIRGGGGNFGVVSSFEFQLHPVGPIVTGGIVAHPFERAAEMLRFYRDFTASLPDELTVFAGVLHAPDGSGVKIAAMLACHCGPLDAGEAALRPLKEFGPPIMDMMGPIPYSALNAALDAGFPKGALNYWKSSFVSQLSDAAIDTIVERFAACPSPMSGMLLEHFHGAATRVGPTETAFSQRETGYNFLVAAEWMDPAANATNVAWTRDAFSAMEPHLAGRRYVNYLGEGEDAGAVAQAYGPNHARLRQVKAKYDPNNVFHLNQNIQPGG